MIVIIAWTLIGIGVLADAYNLLLLFMAWSRNRWESSIFGPQLLFYIPGALLIPGDLGWVNRLLLVTLFIALHSFAAGVVPWVILPWINRRRFGSHEVSTDSVDGLLSGLQTDGYLVELERRDGPDLHFVVSNGGTRCALYRHALSEKPGFEVLVIYPLGPATDLADKLNLMLRPAKESR